MPEDQKVIDFKFEHFPGAIKSLLKVYLSGCIQAPIPRPTTRKGRVCRHWHYNQSRLIICKLRSRNYSLAHVQSCDGCIRPRKHSSPFSLLRVGSGTRLVCMYIQGPWHDLWKDIEKCTPIYINNCNKQSVLAMAYKTEKYLVLVHQKRQAQQ